MEPVIGKIGYAECMVTEANLATTLGSGLQPVFSTPAMLALLEGACDTSIQEYLDPGESTVGIAANITHIAPSPIGCKIHCDSKLVKVDRKKLFFEVKVYDDYGLIGEGTHDRFIIDVAKFQERAAKKQK